MPFANSLLGQAGGLVRSWIKSPNFLTGVRGWIIRKDGSAEFQNIVIRGTFDGTNYEFNALGEFFYSGAPALGNLIVSITNAAGADDGHGNPFLAGVTSYTPNSFYSELLAGSLLLGSNNPATRITGPVTVAVTDATTDGGAPAVSLVSPGVTGRNSVLLELFSDSLNGVQTTKATLTGGLPGVSVPLTVNGPLSFGADGSVLATLTTDATSHIVVPSALSLTAQAAPGNPPAGFCYVYLNSVDGLLHVKYSNGKDRILRTNDDWHSLGALGAHYTVTFASYKFSADGMFVDIDFNVTGDGLQAGTVNFANALPAAYRPATSHTALPLGSTRAVTAADVWPRWAVDSATGNVSVTVTPVAGIIYAGRASIPLDAVP